MVETVHARINFQGNRILGKLSVSPELADTLGNKSNISLRTNSLFSRVLYLLKNKSY